MKKYLLIAFMLVTTMSLAAQTFNNPRHRTNNKYVKASKVVRNKDHTVLYITVNFPDAKYVWIDAYPTLTDEVNGKVYTAKKAMNFKFGTRYTCQPNKSYTYQIEFPPIPRSASLVTFREKGNTGWVLTNIAVPVKEKPKQQPKTQSTNQGKTIIINM